MENFGSGVCMLIYQKKIPTQGFLIELYEILRAHLNIFFNFRDTKCRFSNICSKWETILLPTGFYDSYHGFNSL